MKTMTCAQLGGPASCTATFQADTFQEIGNLSKQHAMQMMSDPDHLQAMESMKQLMTDSQAMQQWMAEKQALFESLPQDQ